jgi:hypothetical protein
MSMNTLTVPVSASRGWLWEFLEGRPPMAMYPEEAEGILQYQVRLSHLRTPDPCEGETTEARSCFFLRYYSGKREIFWADTEAQTLIPLSLLVSYKGHREFYPNLEIGTPR